MFYCGLYIACECPEGSKSVTVFYEGNVCHEENHKKY